MSVDDDSTVVFGNLETEHRKMIVDRFVSYNPSYQGAECEDILELLHQHDSDLETIDKFCKSNPDIECSKAVSIALIALALMTSDE